MILALLLACSPGLAEPPPTELVVGELRMALVRPEGEAVSMGATEVSNAWLRAFRPEHSSNRFQRPHYVAAGLDLDGDSQPAIVTLLEARAFCAWLSEQTGRTVRLPTEAEWERFARAGSGTRWSWGDDPAGSAAFANLAGPDTFALVVQGDPAYPQDDRAVADPHIGTAPVGSYQPNAWGLHDMHGNVAEWTSTPWSAEEPGSYVHRGGSWNHGPGLAESGARNYCFEDQHYVTLGMRVVVE